MSNVVRLRIKEPSGQDWAGVSMPDADLLAAKSLRNSWESIVGDLRQMEAYLAECRCVLHALDDSPDKERSMSRLTEVEIEVQQTRANCVALLAVCPVPPTHRAE